MHTHKKKFTGIKSDKRALNSTRFFQSTYLGISHLAIFLVKKNNAHVIHLVEMDLWSNYVALSLKNMSQVYVHNFLP